MPSPEQLTAFVQSIGVVGLLVIALLAFYRRWVVLGADHDKEVAELKADRDEWKDLALRGLTTADRATTVAAAVIATPRRKV